jgi:hypothetical protein
MDRGTGAAIRPKRIACGRGLNGDLQHGLHAPFLRCVLVNPAELSRAEAIHMECSVMFLDYDNTLPLPADVEQEFLDQDSDPAGASAWLTEFGIDVRPIIERVGCIALVQSATTWDPDQGRYQFRSYGHEHIGPKYPSSFAIPIIEAGAFIDLLLIDCTSFTFTTACGRAEWLGRDEIGGDDVVRLHSHPMDWLAAGCRGVCHIESISRDALKDLRSVRRVICNDIHTALEAWGWSSHDDGVPGRWMIDDEPGNILAYFDKLADRRVRRALQNLTVPRPWRVIALNREASMNK